MDKKLLGHQSENRHGFYIFMAGDIGVPMRIIDRIAYVSFGAGDIIKANCR